MIPVPISAPQIVAMLIIIAATFFVVLLLPALLELRRPKDAGPRRIFESGGKEIVGYSVFFAVYSKDKWHGLTGLDDIESPVFEPPIGNLFSLPLPDMEF